MANDPGKRRIDGRTIEQDSDPFGVECPEPITLFGQDEQDSQDFPGAKTHEAATDHSAIGRSPAIPFRPLDQRQKHLDLQAVIDY
jgi:hypothetical protein